MKVQKIVLSLVRTAAAPTKGGGMPGSTRLRLATAVVFLLGAGAQAFAESGHAVGPGCDPERHAIAYHAGSILGAAWETSRHGNLPVPCAVVTGSTTETATVGVSRDGTLFYAPQSTGVAVPPGVFTSRDDGATWNVQTPTADRTEGAMMIAWLCPGSLARSASSVDTPPDFIAHASQCDEAPVLRRLPLDRRTKTTHQSV